MSQQSSAPNICVMCRSDIRAGAKLCAVCNSYQSWSARWAAIGGKVITSFGAGVACVASVVSLYLLIRQQVVSKRDDIVLEQPQAVTHESRLSLSIVGTNLGNAPGVIRGALMRVPPELVSKTGTPLIEFEVSDSAVIGSGETKVILLKCQDVKPPEPAGRLDAPTLCKVEVQILHFGGKTETVTLTYSAASRKPLDVR